MKESVGITFLLKKIPKNRLKWFGHIERRYIEKSCGFYSKESR